MSAADRCRAFVTMGPLGVQCERETHPDTTPHRAVMHECRSHAIDTFCSVATQASVSVVWEAPVAIDRAACETHGMSADRISERTGVPVRG